MIIPQAKPDPTVDSYQDHRSLEISPDHSRYAGSEV